MSQLTSSDLHSMDLVLTISMTQEVVLMAGLLLLGTVTRLSKFINYNLDLMIVILGCSQIEKKPYFPIFLLAVRLLNYVTSIKGADRY